MKMALVTTYGFDDSGIDRDGVADDVDDDVIDHDGQTDQEFEGCRSQHGQGFVCSPG
jgi:hypothetical protein